MIEKDVICQEASFSFEEKPVELAEILSLPFTGQEAYLLKAEGLEDLIFARVLDSKEEGRADDMRAYYSHLQAAGFTLPPFYKALPFESEDEEKILEMVTFMGYETDEEKLLKSGDEEFIEWFGDRLEELGKIYDYNQQRFPAADRLQVSFDPHPGNYVSGTYIDFHPAYISGIKDSTNRRFSREKLTLSLLAKTTRLRPVLQERLTEEVIGFLRKRDFLTEATFIESLPRHRVSEIKTRLSSNAIIVEKEQAIDEIQKIIINLNPFTQGDEIADIIWVFLKDFDPKEASYLASVFFPATASDGITTASQFAELLYFGKKKLPRELRKMAIYLAKVSMMGVEKLKTAAETYEIMQRINNGVSSRMMALGLRSFALATGSFAREKINGLSDMDYIVGLTEDEMELINNTSLFFGEKGHLVSIPSRRELTAFINSEIDSVKIKGEVEGIKASFRFFSQSSLEHISTGRPFHYRIVKKAKCSVHEHRGFRGEWHHYVCDGSFPNIVKIDGQWTIGKAVEVVAISVPTYDPLWHGERLQKGVYRLLTRGILFHNDLYEKDTDGKITGVKEEAFNLDYLMPVLYHSKRSSYSQEALERLGALFFGELRRIDFFHRGENA